MQTSCFPYFCQCFIIPFRMIITANYQIIKIAMSAMSNVNHLLCENHALACDLKYMTGLANLAAALKRLNNLHENNQRCHAVFSDSTQHWNEKKTINCQIKLRNKL